jgi:hypothetical protein
MSIEQNWKQLNEGGDDDLSSLLQPGRLQNIHSSNPLQKIKRHLFINICWGLVIILLYVFVMIKFPFWQIWLTIGLTLAFTVWGVCTAYIQYKGIRPGASSQSSLLVEMERHYEGIRNWVKLQMKVAVFIYPVAAVGGFMVGGIPGSGKSIEVFLNKPFVWVALLITVAILVPCGLYTAKWMLAKSFGKYLTVLKKNIDELKEGGS